MAVTLLTTSELAAIAWIGSIQGFSTQMVATQLPADNTTWAATGFVTVAVVGGSPDIYLPVKKPVLQVDCYAVKPGSNKPPWWKANVLAERIRYATLARTGFNRLLTPSANGVAYPSANVRAAYLVTEPRRVFGDLSDYAIYSMDLLLEWATHGDTLA